MELKISEINTESKTIWSKWKVMLFVMKYKHDLFKQRLPTITSVFWSRCWHFFNRSECPVFHMVCDISTAPLTESVNQLVVWYVFVSISLEKCKLDLQVFSSTHFKKTHCCQKILLKNFKNEPTTKLINCYSFRYCNKWHNHCSKTFRLLSSSASFSLNFKCT